MSNVLLLTNDIGPAEGAVYSDLKRNGHRVFTYNVAGQWVPRERGVPFWMRGYRTRLSPMARNWFTRVIEPKNIERIITSGLDAAAFAARNTSEEFYPLLWRGDLDFPERNQSSTDAFADLTRTSDRLLLEDPWEMDKAISKNSQVIHLRMRYPIPADRDYLKSDSASVAIIYPSSDLQGAERTLDAAHKAFGASVHVELININSLYQSEDLDKGLDFYETLELRLKKYSFAIILGTGPHHSTILRALEHDRERIVVDQTVGMSFLSQELNLPFRGRKLSCVQMMKQLIETAENIGRRREAGPSTTVSDDYLENLDQLWKQDFNQWFEELPAVTNDEPLNIFFSVAALQDLTTGARHQRIRNMHDAFSQTHHTYNIFGSKPFFDRRVKLALQMLAEGQPAGIFYGENSTTPMTVDLSDRLTNFLQEFSRAGGRSMWFVRDLHWLGISAEVPWTVRRAAELKSEGLHELQKIGGTVDVLAAPSQRTGEGFNQLLLDAGGEPREWFQLPPAVEPQNIIDDTNLVDNEGVTVLYSGGISEIYGMDLYLSALTEVDENVAIDFVVREPEAASLHAELERLRLLPSERVRVLHTTMDLYRPRTKRTLGMILLDSEYARFSFPYKTVTMIERGYPILCFSDMSIAKFVTDKNLGVAVERSPESIRDGIKSLIENGAPGIPRAQATETWANRAKLVRKTLALRTNQASA